MVHHIRDWLNRLKRFTGGFYYINKGRLAGRTYLRHPRARLFIETVSFCNLGCKFCTYPKHLHPRGVMSDQVFEDCIDQAAAMGFRFIALTPINGDVFVDKAFMARLRYLEASPIPSYGFYTNFIGADPSDIGALIAMRKLTFLEISVYGHDPESFRNITARGEAQYRRLVDNLRTLAGHLAERSRDLRLVVNLRTYKTFSLADHPRNDLLDALDALARDGIDIGVSSTVDSWGGAITHTDVAAIGMDMVDGLKLYKHGACALPFDSIQITAAGAVNACACRDPAGSLNLGSLDDGPLTAILSTANEKWRSIVADHDKGRFNSVCAACGFYKSIHDERHAGDDACISRDAYMAIAAKLDGDFPAPR